MKPQKPKNPFSDTTQTQAVAGTSSSAENPSTSMEQAASASPSNLPFSKQKLNDIIASLERDLLDGSWIKEGANRKHEEIDLQLMPALVEQANRKHQDLNLQFFTDCDHYAGSLKEAITNGVPSSRAIIALDCGMVHFAVVDQRTMGDQTSVILFEPTKCDHLMSHMLASRMQTAIDDYQLPHCHFAIAEMGIQHSPSEAGIISLALTKKFHTRYHDVTQMHENNVRGLLCKPDEVVPSDKVDQYLSVRFYKHTQDRERLEKYIAANPGSKHRIVNKQYETLQERFDKNVIKEANADCSASAHRKRVKEYKALMM